MASPGVGVLWQGQTYGLACPQVDDRLYPAAVSAVPAHQGGKLSEAN